MCCPNRCWPHCTGRLESLAVDALVRVVVLAGSGKAFCAGHDLKQMMADPSLEYYQRLFDDCSRLMMRIQAMPQPVIARVHGVATAAGCQLVAMCDLAIAAAEARFAVSGINVGLFCATPSVALSRAIGRKSAFEMLVTGEFIDAATAAARGLINRCVPADGLDAEIGKTVRGHSCQTTFRGRVGQGLVLPSARTGNGSGLRRRRGGYGLQYDGACRAGGGFCLHCETTPEMERRRPRLTGNRGNVRKSRPVLQIRSWERGGFGHLFQPAGPLKYTGKPGVPYERRFRRRQADSLPARKTRFGS